MWEVSVLSVMTRTAGAWIVGCECRFLLRRVPVATIVDNLEITVESNDDVLVLCQEAFTVRGPDPVDRQCACLRVPEEPLDGDSDGRLTQDKPLQHSCLNIRITVEITVHRRVHAVMRLEEISESGRKLTRIGLQL